MQLINYKLIFIWFATRVIFKFDSTYNLQLDILNPLLVT